MKARKAAERMTFWMVIGATLTSFIMFGVGSMVERYKSPTRRRIRLMQQTKRWPIAELPENTLGRLVGKVQRLDAILRAPLSGRACVMYRVTVEHRHQRHISPSGMRIIDDQVAVPFALVDDSGQAFVDPTDTKFLVDVDANEFSGMFDPASALETEFLARHGVSSTEEAFNKALHFRESILGLGEAITVVGIGVREPDPAVASTDPYRRGPGQRVRLTGSAEEPLLVTDKPSAFKGGSVPD